MGDRGQNYRKYRGAFGAIFWPFANKTKNYTMHHESFIVPIIGMSIQHIIKKPHYRRRLSFVQYRFFNIFYTDYNKTTIDYWYMRAGHTVDRELVSMHHYPSMRYIHPINIFISTSHTLSSHPTTVLTLPSMTVTDGGRRGREHY